MQRFRFFQPHGADATRQVFIYPNTPGGFHSPYRLAAWTRQQPETLADMAARFVPLSDALDGLNGALYSETGQQGQGEDLWRAIRTLPSREASANPATQEANPLPPLYPR